MIRAVEWLQDAQWDGSCCPGGAFCQRLQRFMWQCASLDAANTIYLVQNGSIPALDQCGEHPLRFPLQHCTLHACSDRPLHSQLFVR